LGEQEGGVCKLIIIKKYIMIKFFRTFYRNNITYPVTQRIREHESIREVIVYTFVGDKLLHVSEVRISPLRDYVDRLRFVMDDDRRSAKVFRETVYKVK